MVVISDDADWSSYQRRLPSDLIQIQAVPPPFREELVGVAIESKLIWNWVVDGLMEDGFQVHKNVNRFFVTGAPVNVFMGRAKTDASSNGVVASSVGILHSDALDRAMNRLI